MEVILLKDLDKVGYKHTIVTVKNGYGRNYLIPQKLALIANTTNRKRLADLERQEEAKEAKMVGVYEEMATKLEGKTLKIGAKAGTSGKIFGSVTNVQVMAALKEQFGMDIERKKILLPDEIKNIGSYEMTLRLHKDVQPKLAFEVVEE